MENESRRSELLNELLNGYKVDITYLIQDDSYLE